jgi:hypothetical protein
MRAWRAIRSRVREAYYALYSAGQFAIEKRWELFHELEWAKVPLERGHRITTIIECLVFLIGWVLNLLGSLSGLRASGGGE